jgi:mono/diheme cytochrome c family protein
MRFFTFCSSLIFLFACEKVKQEKAKEVVEDSVIYVKSKTPEEAGKYLILVGGCNDCHTPGWDISGGNIPESEWLVGNKIGYRGPWGTTYPSNLRILVYTISEDDWVNMFRTRKERPPMPWHNYHQVSEQDLRAMYRFIKSLGPKGDSILSKTWYVPPDQEPKTPYILLAPIEKK